MAISALHIERDRAAEALHITYLQSSSLAPLSNTHHYHIFDLSSLDLSARWSYGSSILRLSGYALIR